MMRWSVRMGFGITLAVGAPRLANAQAPLGLVPRPVEVLRSQGVFRLDREVFIVADTSLAEVGDLLATYLRPAVGSLLRVTTSGTGRRIVLTIDPSVTGTLGEEGYQLRVTPEGVAIRGGGRAGVFYGTQTLRQLLPPERLAGTEGDGVDIPAVTVSDRPRFSWRGAHLDVGRHFMPVEFVKKFLDLMALHKLNRFHWHLTEDQGWRIEIRRYPRFVSVGSCRRETLVGRPTRDSTSWVYDGVPHCGFYTQDEVRDVVAYAAARSITIVPEIEMPGHSQAAIAAYPWLGVTGRQIAVWGGWGVSPWIFSPDPETIRVLQNVLGEILELFPGPFIHIGGDEAPKGQWQASERVQALIRELGVGDEHGLQSWFIRQMDSWLAERGRRLIGWDEILEGGLAPGATVMSWRGTQGGIAAAREGHDVVMTPGSHTYFDHYQSGDHEREPLAIGGFLPLDTVYAYEPVPAELTPEEARHVLGTQAQHWTEYITSPAQVEYMAFPRLAALAEVAWTAASLRDWSGFRRRLDTHVRRLAALDVHYRPLDDEPGRTTVP